MTPAEARRYMDDTLEYHRGYQDGSADAAMRILAVLFGGFAGMAYYNYPACQHEPWSNYAGAALIFLIGALAFYRFRNR